MAYSFLVMSGFSNDGLTEWAEKWLIIFFFSVFFSFWRFCERWMLILWMFDRIDQWSHLFLIFSLFQAFDYWFSLFSLVELIYLFMIPSWSGCIFLEIYPFLLYFAICCHIVSYDFCISVVCWNTFSFIYTFESFFLGKSS